MKKYFLFTFFLSLLILGSCEQEPCNCENEDPEISEALVGNWVRVGSNNENYDGMVIKVTNNQGVILSVNEALSFSVGDIKWKDITPAGDNEYSYQELGSDNNYYEASIEMLNDSTLSVMVTASGAGSEQKWVKEGTGSAGPTSTVILDCGYFDSPRTLTNGPAEIDYLIDCVTDVTAALTIEPGVVIAFTENAGLGVYDGGTLNAVGSEEDPIVFMGYNEAKGYWRGIHLETVSTMNELNHVTIKDAGSNYVYCCPEPSSLFIKGGRIALNNVSIENGAGIGLMATSGTEFSEYANISVTTHDDYPASFSSDVLSYLDGAGSDYTGNAIDAIFVEANKINDPVNWHTANVPYLLEGSVMDVTALLTIDAGTEIMVSENGAIGVYDEGALKVMGTASSPVTIKGKEEVLGYWRGIQMETNSINNQLNYLNIYHAGSDYVYCCSQAAALYFKAGKCAVNHLNVSSGELGIHAADAFTFTSYSNVTVESDDVPLMIAIERATELDAESVYSSNSSQKNYIAFITGTDVTDPVVITNPDASIPYMIDYVVDVKAQLDIQAGVQIVFKENGGLGVTDDGILNISGSSAENVMLYGMEDVQGYWRGISTATNSLNNNISYTQISNAGSNYVYCCNPLTAVYVKSGKLNVSNSGINSSGGYGIYVESAATLTQSDNTFSNNAEANIFEE